MFKKNEDGIEVTEGGMPVGDWCSFHHSCTCPCAYNYMPTEGPKVEAYKKAWDLYEAKKKGNKSCC